MATKGNTRTVRSPAAKSAVQTAVQEATRPTAQILPIGGGKAAGMALATKHHDAAVKESANWRGFFAEILSLGMGDANKAYRAALNEQKKADAAKSKETGVQLSRTAGVRMSECLTVAKAGDRGLTMRTVVEMFNEKGIGAQKDEDTIAHAWIVTAAREWNDHHDADGKEVESANSRARAGRAKMDVTEKVKRYILSTYPVADLPKIARLCAALAKRVKTTEQATAELAKKEPAIPTKGDRRAEPRGEASEPTPAQVRAAEDKARVQAAIAAGPTKPIDSTPKRVTRKAAAVH